MGFWESVGIFAVETTKFLAVLNYFADIRQHLTNITRPLTLVEQKQLNLLTAWDEYWAAVQLEAQFKELLAEANDISLRQKRFQEKVRRFLPPPKMG